MTQTATASDAIQRLLANTTDSDGCLEWNGARDRKGYGFVKLAGKSGRVHRVLYQLVHGVTLNRQQFVCHRCDNPPCINPSHLFVGTHADNMQDMVRKGRAARLRLTDAEVLDIRREAAVVPAADLAQKYGVDRTTIQKIGVGSRRGLVAA